MFDWLTCCRASISYLSGIESEPVGGLQELERRRRRCVDPRMFLFSGFQIAVFTEHKTRRPCRNARIALARAGSSENNNTLNPKPKKVERSQPEMLIRTTVKLSILINCRGRLREIGGTKFEAKRPWQNPYSHGYRGQTHTQN